MFVTACSMYEYAEEKRTGKNLLYAAVSLKPKQIIIKDCARHFVQTRSIARPLCDSRASCHCMRQLFGVVVDQDLSLASHVTHVTSVCFSHLRQLRLVRRSLTIDTAHALVSSGSYSQSPGLLQWRVCRSPSGSVQPPPLQSVLRASARLVLGLPGRAPVMSAIRDTLHWLCYPQRVTFKLCLTTYKCLHGLAPPYLTRFCTPLRRRRWHTLAFCRSTQTVRPPHVYIDV